MKFLATFHCHYDATLFYQMCKQREIPAKLTPTPRKLSAACGTCVIFDKFADIDYNNYDVGGVYEGDGYVKIWASEEN